MMAVREEENALVVDVHVVPRASRTHVGPAQGGVLKVHVTAPPVDGAANDAVRAALADALGVAKGRVTIVRGESGRKKTVRIEGVRADAIRPFLDGDE